MITSPQQLSYIGTMLKKILSHNSFLFLRVSTKKSSQYFGRILLSQRIEECIKIRQCVCILKIFPCLSTCCLSCWRCSIWRRTMRVSHQFCCVPFLLAAVLPFPLPSFVVLLPFPLCCFLLRTCQAASSSSHALVFS